MSLEEHRLNPVSTTSCVAWTSMASIGKIISQRHPSLRVDMKTEGEAHALAHEGLKQVQNFLVFPPPQGAVEQHKCTQQGIAGASEKCRSSCPNKTDIETSFEEDCI